MKQLIGNLSEARKGICVCVLLFIFEMVYTDKTSMNDLWEGQHEKDGETKNLLMTCRVANSNLHSSTETHHVVEKIDYAQEYQ